MAGSEGSSSDSSQDAVRFVGTDRFLVQRRIGSGAFGVVYEAYDRQEKSLVALKVLRVGEADSLYRFKKGFRSLADIRHPNLVSFYELTSHDDLWFFSMELISGRELVEALGLGEDDYRPDFGRIRDVTLQLAQGLLAVHEHGKVHRDIKPPNVLVSDKGRVKLLDFGLVTELGRRSFEGEQGQLVGTPAYMSPEQADGDSGNAAGDWYSVGVMLYQMLAGELPFEGSLLEILARKRKGLAPDALRSSRPNLPDDLEQLCLSLLDPDPATRLSGPELISVLEGGLRDERRTGTIEISPFVGRRLALERLGSSFESSRSSTVVAHVKGPSGMGKSALIERFVQQLEMDHPNAVVLSGRCYVQESVPYKALDSLVDALSRHLMALPKSEVEIILPQKVLSLARLFPVLSRVSAVADARRVGEAASTARLAATPGELRPQVERRRAVSALRGLLRRLSRNRPLVLIIDDLQWGDLDSFELLSGLFGSGRPLPVLVVCSYRIEDESSSPFLKALAEARRTEQWSAVEMRDIELEELTADEALELWQRLGVDSQRIRSAAAIVRDAAGSPLFLAELAQSEEVPTDPAQGRPLREVRVDDLIRARVGQLTGPARQLLEVVAVAGQPVDVDTARQAAQMDAGGVSALSELRSGRLVRWVDTDRQAEVVCYHDRIREAVTDGLGDTGLREIHGRLAHQLELTGQADPETLAVHFRATAEDERACGYAVSAAVQAEATLAFARAARLYRLALDLLPRSRSSRESTGELPSRSDLQVRLGRALGNAGLNRAAADTFLRAVESGVVDPVDAQRAAAEKLLISGHIDRGLKVLRHVLRTVDMELEQAPWRALVDLWVSRLRLRLRGFHFEETDEAELEEGVLRRIDVCWSVEVGLCLVDVLRASQYHARHLLLALQAGEPQRVARGLAMEVFFGAMEGTVGRDVLERARDLAGRVEGTYAASLTEMAAGMLACSKGEWVDAQQRLSRAEMLLRENRRGVTWEIDTVRQFRSVAMVHLGRWQELFSEVPALLEQAHEQEDLYLATHLLNWAESLRLFAAGKPEEARQAVASGFRSWSREGFHFQHFGHLQARVHGALYQGKGREAWEAVDGAWPDLTGSLLQRIEMVLVQSHDLRGRAAIARAVEEATLGDRKGRWNVQRGLRQASHDARRLEAAGSPWAMALAAAIDAGSASVQGNRGRAEASLDLARVGFEQASMVMHEAVARRRLCQLQGDSAGLASADAFLGRESVRDPEAISAIFLPGLWIEPAEG